MWFLVFTSALWASAIPQSSPTVIPIAPSPMACPESVGALALSGVVEANDPRLQSKFLVVVLKKSRRVMRMSEGLLLRWEGKSACWKAGLGFAPMGHKMIEGDGKTPEGFYTSSDKPSSSFYAAIAVHYPNEKDATMALQDGRINASIRTQIVQSLKADSKPPQQTAMGGEILIHGGGSATDWTLGCVAMDDADIDALRKTLPLNMVTDVLILP